TAFASNQLGRFFVKARLPLISGFLFTGIIAGPFVLGMIPEGATRNLRFVDETSLAFIAFAAGSELYLRELTSRLRSIAWVTVGLVASTFFLGSLSIFLLADYVPFMQAMPATHRIAVSAMGGAMLVARSPASAIAVVKELRAKGPFTQTALGVTVIMDGVVIALFAVNSSIADALLTDLGLDLSFLLLLLIELLMSLAIAFALAKLLQFVLSRRTNSIAKTGMLLAAGYGVFFLSAEIREFSRDQLRVEVLLEPLLICMVASFLVTNYSRYRTEFLKILHDTGPPIYVAFFTLTGASLALDVLAKTWTIALALFFVRLVAIYIGSFSGGALAGDPMRHNRISWMCYITQAGVALGLAKEAAVEFPEWGSDFATIIISVVVLNQIVGPAFFKFAVTMAGEAHPRVEVPKFEGARNALIFGLEEQSLALARQLRHHDWQVKIASTKEGHDETMAASDLDIQPLSRLALDALHQVGAGHANTIVTMLSDEENYRICELAYEHFGTDNLVVRLNDRANFDRFTELGALVVDSTTAMVSLLDHSVRSPTAVSLLLGMEENQDIVDLEVRNPALRGVPLRDLRLPLDTLVLSIHRGGQMLISHGDTRLKVGDRMTVVGSLESLEEVMLRCSDPLPSTGYEPRKRELDRSGLRVEHVMRREVIAIPEGANFDQVVDFVAHSRVSHFPIVDREGMLKGQISFEEIRDVLFDEGLSSLVIASDLAREDVPSLSPQDTLEHAISQFDECGSSCLPVVDPHDPRKLIGLLEQRSVLCVYHKRGRAGDRT
ncbi:MAG: cation:proton antiporter, partial [Pirellulaceae bacterium]